MIGKHNNFEGILKINKSSIGYYGDNLIKELSFNKDVFDQLEIKNRTKYVENINNFVEDLKIDKQNILVILSTEIYYVHSFTDNELDQDYLNKVPISNDQIVSRVYKVGETRKAISYDKLQLNIIRKILEDHKNKIIAFVPQEVLQISESIENDIDNLNKINLDDLVSKDIFAVNTDSKVDEGIPQDKSSKISNILALIKQPRFIFMVIFMVLTLVIAIFVVTSVASINNKSDNNIQSQNNIAQQTIEPEKPESEATPTPEPTIEVIDIAETDVLISNGTKIAGLASSTKELITDLGFKQIDTSNYSQSDLSSTTIYYSNNISNEVIEEIKLKLLDKFDEVKIAQQTGNSDHDIIVIVGNNLK